MTQYRTQHVVGNSTHLHVVDSAELKGEPADATTAALTTVIVNTGVVLIHENAWLILELFHK